MHETVVSVTDHFQRHPEMMAAIFLWNISLLWMGRERSLSAAMVLIPLTQNNQSNHPSKAFFYKNIVFTFYVNTKAIRHVSDLRDGGWYVKLCVWCCLELCWIVWQLCGTIGTIVVILSDCLYTPLCRKKRCKSKGYRCQHGPVVHGINNQVW